MFGAPGGQSDSVAGRIPVTWLFLQVVPAAFLLRQVLSFSLSNVGCPFSRLYLGGCFHLESCWARHHSFWSSCLLVPISIDVSMLAAPRHYPAPAALLSIRSYFFHEWCLLYSLSWTSPLTPVAPRRLPVHLPPIRCVSLASLVPRLFPLFVGRCRAFELESSEAWGFRSGSSPSGSPLFSSRLVVSSFSFSFGARLTYLTYFSRLFPSSSPSSCSLIAPC